MISMKESFPACRGVGGSRAGETPFMSGDGVRETCLICQNGVDSSVYLESIVLIHGA